MESRDKFNPNNWDIEYEEREIVGFRIEYFDFQLITYDRNKKEILFTLDDNNKQYIDNYTEYGQEIFTIGNTVKLSNTMNNELLHVFEGNNDEPISENYILVNPMKVMLLYSDKSTKMVCTIYNKDRHYGNKFLNDLDLFLRNNFAKDMCEIDYDVEYCCPQCGHSFKKSYSGFIFHDVVPIICNQCNYDLVNKMVITQQKKKQIIDKKSASKEEIERLQKELKSKKGLYIACMVISFIIVAFFIFVGLLQGVLGGTVFFVLFLALTIKTNNKLCDLKNENKKQQ